MGDVSDISDEELVRRAVRNAWPKDRVRVPRWSAVGEVFALGSTYSTQLCRRFDVDPNKLVGPEQEHFEDVE